MATQVRFKRSHVMEHPGREPTRYYPGDFETVAPGVAAKLIERGIAEAMKPIMLSEDLTTGLVLVAPTDALAEALRRSAGGARVIVADVEDLPALLEGLPPLVHTPDVPDNEYHVPSVVVWYDGTVPAPSAARLIQGIEGLRRGWDMALPMGDYKKLAEDVGSDAERAKTRALIGDLRVPVLNPGLLFLAPAAREWVVAWLEDLTPDPSPKNGDGGKYPVSRELAALRALWKTMPRYLPMPATWAGAPP